MFRVEGNVGIQVISSLGEIIFLCLYFAFIPVTFLLPFMYDSYLFSLAIFGCNLRLFATKHPHPRLFQKGMDTASSRKAKSKGRSVLRQS